MSDVAQIRKLLEKQFWPETLKPQTVYERTQDDHDGTFVGRISVSFDQQGDAWLWTDKHHFPPMRFRTWNGGGMSIRVRNALMILAEAIRLDNELAPQPKPIPQRPERMRRVREDAER